MKAIDARKRAVRLDLTARRVEVRHIDAITPTYVRITFGGEQLAGFQSPDPQDHFKLLLPNPGEEAPTLPEIGPDGMRYPEGAVRPVIRDYTPLGVSPRGRARRQLGDGGRAAAIPVPDRRVLHLGGRRGLDPACDPPPPGAGAGGESRPGVVLRSLETGRRRSRSPRADRGVRIPTLPVLAGRVSRGAAGPARRLCRHCRRRIPDRFRAGSCR